ncbi:acyltransferase [Acidisphaera sp. S103]|uniref:acyltransferase family protein n=1 Tax=Acidisphaera sp. S103 TaxID=1747223 RepID=UPI00131E142F|nr:acyltransferase [Acidisphaera sp. S103]
MLQLQTKAHRFAVLDGLRGVAALVVLTLHLVQQHDLTALPFAGLAVDFFYLLSGFVVSFAYERRLQSGSMDLASFARIRITRLYPLILLGTAMGIALALLAATVKLDVTYEQIALSGTLALLLLPSYVFPQWETAYPFNMASWSLAFELFVNAVYGVIAPHLTSRRLMILTACSAVVLAWVAFMNHGIYGGNNQGNFAYGFGRVMFPFFAGVLLYRCRISQHFASWIGLGLILSLAVLLLLPLHISGLFDLLYVVLLFPAIIAIGAAVEPGPRLAQGCRIAGELSYPLYILQGPVLRIGEELLRHWHFGLIGCWLFGIIEAGIVAEIAYLSLKFYDKPLQQYFKLKGRPAPALQNF